MVASQIEKLSKITINFQIILSKLDRGLQILATRPEKYVKNEEQLRRIKGVVDNALFMRRNLDDLDTFFRMRPKHLRDVMTLFAILPQIRRLRNAIQKWVYQLRGIEEDTIINKTLCTAALQLLGKLIVLYEPLKKQISGPFRKSFRRNIDVKSANPSLSGKITLHIIFMPQEKRFTEIEVQKDTLLRLAILEYALEKKMDISAYCEMLTNLITVSLKNLLKENPDVFTRIYGSKIRTQFTLYIQPFNRPLSAAFPIRILKKIAAFGKDEIILNIDVSLREMRILFSLDQLAKRYDSMGEQQFIKGMSVLFAHELTHAFDKRMLEGENLTDHVRTEGLALFAEGMQTPKAILNKLPHKHINSLHRWEHLEELEEELEKNSILTYTLGLVMCLGILCLVMKRRFRFPTNPYALDEIQTIFSEPQYRNVINDVYRQINAMNTLLFFKIYQKAVAEGVAPELFSKGLIESIDTPKQWMRMVRLVKRRFPQD